MLADDHAYVVFGAIAALALFLWLVSRALAHKELDHVSLRTIEEPVEDRANPEPLHPYRARVRNAAMRAVPRVSGTQATILMLASLALCAVAFPAALRIPRWLEVEVVIGAWWTVLATVLSFLLYKGLRIADDFRFTLRRNSADAKPARATPTQSPAKSSWLDPFEFMDVEGFVAVIVLAVGLGATWLIAEFAAPLFFAACYVLLTRALARVAHDHHECTGRLKRSIAWGTTWATVYVLPLGIAVWIVHALWRR
jgi:hypothetical protein